MSVTVSLFIIDPSLGTVDEDDFDNHDLADLLAADREAGLAIESNGEVIVRDGIDDLLLGMCISVPEMLDQGEDHTHVSFAGYDSAEVSVEVESVSIECDGESVMADKEELVTALREAGERYGEMLKETFPKATSRWQELVDAAS